MNAALRFTFVLSLTLAGCPVDEDAVGTTDTGSAYVCDPVGPDSTVGSLLNAPLDADVEVVIKVPQHPGDPGPEDLP